MILKCLFVVFLMSGLPGLGQNNAASQKVKETFSTKNYQLTIDEINSMNTSGIHFDSILYLKAYSQIKLNQLKEANITITQLQQLNPNYHELYFLKGLIFAMKEKYADAILNFNKVIDANPNHEKAYYNMALAKGLLEDYTSAIKDLDKCIAINPNYALAYYNRGYWYEISENYTAAISDYKKAIELDHHFMEAYLALAYAYSQNGDKANACETLQNAQTEGIEAANDLIQTFCK
ncbi:MAG: Tetratricopeptide 1 repeat-containing protein [Bacteroidota bacterium]|nr:Tetratricopeptide 1 repeat-containing protein [Bacteroidota bacterium]